MVARSATAAIKLDASSAVAHAVLGAVHVQHDWDWPAAAREYATAIWLAPSSSYIRWLSASRHMAVGEWSEAQRAIDAARASDPLDPAEYIVACWLYQRTGRSGDAVRSCRRALEITPTYGSGHYQLGVALFVDGKPEEALDEFGREPDDTLKLVGLAVANQALNRSKDSDLAIARLRAQGRNGWAMGMAYALAVREDKVAAFQSLDQAFAEKDSEVFMFKGNPLLKNLESDPRYKTFLRRMKLPE